MGRDWGEPVDKGPPLEEPAWRRGKHKRKRKPYTIEYRNMRPSFVAPGEAAKWRTWKRYATESQRDMALRALQHRRESSYAFYLFTEFRKGPDEDVSQSNLQ